MSNIKTFKKLRNAFSLLSIVFFILSFAILYLTIVVYGVNHPRNIILGLIFYSITFIFFILFLHLTTVYITEIEASRVGYKTSVNCKYCGGKKAGLVCPSCDSIQWNPRNPLIGTGIYIAHHRNKILTALIAVGLIGPLAFGITEYYELNNKILIQNKSYEDEAKSAMESLLRLRGHLHSNELLNQDSIFNNPDQQTEIIRTLIEEYYAITWFTSRVFDYIDNTICDCQWRSNNGFTERNSDLNSKEERICDIIGKEDSAPLLYLDFRFLDYVNAFQEKMQGKTADTKLESKKLFETAKVISCMIAELTFNQAINKNNSSRKKIYDCNLDEKYVFERIPCTKKNIITDLGEEVIYFVDDSLININFPWGVFNPIGKHELTNEVCLCKDQNNQMSK